MRRYFWLIISLLIFDSWKLPSYFFHFANDCDYLWVRGYCVHGRGSDGVAAQRGAQNILKWDCFGEFYAKPFLFSFESLTHTHTRTPNTPMNQFVKGNVAKPKRLLHLIQNHIKTIHQHCKHKEHILTSNYSILQVKTAFISWLFYMLIRFTHLVTHYFRLSVSLITNFNCFVAKKCRAHLSPSRKKLVEG